MRVARRFIVILTAGIVVVLAAAGVMRVQREQALFEQDIARDARVLGRALRHAVERTWRTRGQEEALELIRHATTQESHIHIRWVWPDAYPGHAHAAVAPSARLEPLEDGEPVVLALGEGVDKMYTYEPVSVPGGGFGAIEIAHPFIDEQRYLQRSIINASAAGLALVILCGSLIWLLGVRLIGEPMKHLVEHARAIGRGELDRRLVLPAKDEIGELAVEMDTMSESLQRARERLQEEVESRIAAMEQLQHADRLATVGTLASGIAHELGTPINVIEGHAQLIGEDAQASTAAKQNAAIIHRQCNKMADIIRNLLDFARQGDSARGESVDVHEVVRQTLKMVDPLVRKASVEVELDEADADARVAAGFQQLQQVVTNVVVNGLHAMPHGGRLEVRIARGPAKPPGTDRPEGEFVILSIEDTGVGLDPESAARIFEPFFTTKEVGEGTGLGLSVAYGIVENCGGWIDVKSRPEHGSTFTIYLPPEQL